jgi:hypothetical protein
MCRQFTTDAQGCPICVKGGDNSPESISKKYSGSKYKYNSYCGVYVFVIVRKLDVQLLMQSMPITTEVVSSNPAHCEIYSIQHYVIKFFSDLRQVSGIHHVD